MSLESGKHIEKEMDGVLYRIVELGITDMDRIKFLEAILLHNGFDVKWAEEPRKNEDKPVTLMIGVTDLTFNPVLAVYGRRLKSPDGHRINPNYWNQKGDSYDSNYWKEWI
jgi:hypothetical protein